MSDLNARYGMNPAHSEVVEAAKLIAPCDVLDMGASNGRNALFLSQQGFNVVAVDNNPNALGMLAEIIQNEGISNIQPQLYDLNQAQINSDFGFIVCTVTLMFLERDRIDAVIKNMQEKTLPGGYNLIVCAMSTKQYPCPVNFPFTLDEGELSDFYQGWELVKYNEDLGTMHNGAELQFATLLAKKPA